MRTAHALIRRSRATIYARTALVLVLSGVGCYRLRIGESFWLHARPGPSADSAGVAAMLPAGYTLTRIAVPAADGAQLVGLAATRPDARTTVLYFGGNDFVVARKGPAAMHALTFAADVNVVLLDYPGSGASGGTPTIATLKAGALATYDWLAARTDLAPHGVVVHGHSIGSFVAAEVATARPVRGLVLQGSATTPEDWLHAFFRPSRLKWWARAAYPFIRFSVDSALAGEDNLARVRQYRGPLLVLSGSADTEAAPAMSRVLVAASASPDSLKRLIELPGSGHEDVYDNPAFAPGYRTFIEMVVANAPAP